MIKSSILAFIVILGGKCAFAQDSLKYNGTMTYFGIGMGTWFADNNNRKLGVPPVFEVVLGVKNENSSFGLSFDLIGWPVGKTKEPINVKYGDSMVTTDEFYGCQLMLDYFQQFLKFKGFMFEGIGSIGVGRLVYYNPDPHTNVGRTSLVFSPGVSIGYVQRSSRFRLKIQYNIANYRLKDNVSTHLNGNSLMVKFIYEGLR